MEYGVYTTEPCSTTYECVQLKSSSIYFDPMPAIVRRTSGTNELSVSRELCLQEVVIEETSRASKVTNCSVNVYQSGSTGIQYYNTLETNTECSQDYQCVQYETYHELFSGCVVGSYILQTREA